MRSKSFRFTIAAGIVCLLACCSNRETAKTNQDVINEYKQQFATQRTKLQALAGQLPPQGSVQDRRTPLTLDPKPVFDKKNEIFNTEILMFEQLLDPDVALSESQSFEIHSHGDLFHCIQWTGPKNPLQVTGEPADDKFINRFQQALGYQHLVVLRVVEYTPPLALDEQTFRGGSLSMEAFLVNLPTSELLASFRFSAEAAPDIYARFSHLIDSKATHRERVAELENLAHSSLYGDMENNLAAILTEITGGTFVFDLA